MGWEWLVRLLSTLLALLGIAGVLLGLPGTFLAWLGVFLVALATRFEAFSGWWLLATLVGCGVVELIDNLISGVLLRRWGASQGSLWLSFLGGIGGSLVGGAIGSIGGFLGGAFLGVLGAFAGSYAVVYYWERYRLNRSHREASHLALITVFGRLLGIAIKLAWIGWLFTFIW